MLVDKVVHIRHLLKIQIRTKLLNLGGNITRQDSETAVVSGTYMYLLTTTLTCSQQH